MGGGGRRTKERLMAFRLSDELHSDGYHRFVYDVTVDRRANVVVPAEYAHLTRDVDADDLLRYTLAVAPELRQKGRLT